MTPPTILDTVLFTVWCMTLHAMILVPVWWVFWRD